MGQLDLDDFVIVFTPRNAEVSRFISTTRAAVSAPERPATEIEAHKPVRPLPPVDVRRHFTVMPRIEALSSVPGEHSCSNDDVIRNTAFNWSPMTA